MALMKKQMKDPKIELSNEEIANLSDAEFKIQVIRMLTEMVEYGDKTEEKLKAMQSEMKRNVQGTNSERRKLGLKSTIWALAGVAQWIERQTVKQKITSFIPS